MSEKKRTITVEVLEELRRFNKRGASHVVEAILEEICNWENPYGPQVYLRDVKGELREERSAMARKGGRRPKRRAWAEKLGEYLATTSSAEEAWEAIPESSEEKEYDRHIIYRDGDRLFALDQMTGVESSIAKSTFLKRYLKRR